ncbi:Uncharacterized protein TCM_037678 [Theobroma cacao]|uniref:Uncharacterized protein n=1 Tax=Theobroma cacao TaxID=3641 RepID=A0A061GLR6_THECC|nr:Uncharacterized protein TCM_037678 [Theobroma cacao]
MKSLIPKFRRKLQVATLCHNRLEQNNWHVGSLTLEPGWDQFFIWYRAVCRRLWASGIVCFDCTIVCDRINLLTTKNHIDLIFYMLGDYDKS